MQPYEYTEREVADIERNFFTEDGILKALPVKTKRKYIAISLLARRIGTQTRYTEKEFNALLNTLSMEDAATIRRELVDFGFVERMRDGSSYWRTEDALTP